MESADTIEGVLEQVNYLDCRRNPVKVNEEFENDPCQDKEYGRFDADLMVDIYGENTICKVSDEKWAKFERGEVKLYALHITVYIHKQTDLDEGDVRYFS